MFQAILSSCLDQLVEKDLLTADHRRLDDSARRAIRSPRTVLNAGRVARLHGLHTLAVMPHGHGVVGNLAVWATA